MTTATPQPFSPPRRDPSRRTPGFTLTEMLMVLALIAVMASFAVPLLGDYPEGRELASEADNIESQMAYARLIAMSSGAPVEVRFYLEPISDTAIARNDEFIRSSQIMVVNDEGIYRPDARAQSFAGKTIILNDPTYSSIMAGEPEGPDANAGATRNRAMAQRRYKSLRFMPDGSTNLGRGGGEYWTLTLVTWDATLIGGDTEGVTIGPGTQFPNFVTLQIDPFNAKVRRYEPGR